MNENLSMLENGKVARSPSKFPKWLLATTFVLLLFFAGIWQSYMTEESTLSFITWDGNERAKNITTHLQAGSVSYRSDNVMEILLQKKVYNTTDFTNEIGTIPPYWVNGSSPTHPSETKTESIGPCFLSNTPVHWADTGDHGLRRYPTSGVGLNKNDWSNYCLPGFLIIGAGKCGTSVRSHMLATRTL